MNTIWTAMLSIAFSVAAQFLLKAGMSTDRMQAIRLHPLGLQALILTLMDKHVLAGFLFYGIGALVWLQVLSQWDVSKAYPLVGLGFVFTVVIGYLLGEHVGAVRVLGVALICTGVVLVARSN